MQLNHLDLQVSDVQKTVTAFETFFGLTLQTTRRSPALAVLSDGLGFLLVLQRAESPAYPDGFHLGFLVDEIAAVHETHARLVALGAQVSPIERNNRGTMLYCRLDDGIVVEVSCRKRE